MPRRDSDMLSAQHKAQILARAGYRPPPCPATRQAGQPTDQAPAGTHQQQAGHDGDARGTSALAAWCREIDRLYTRYATERALRSLREDEQTRPSATRQYGGDLP